MYTPESKYTLYIPFSHFSTDLMLLNMLSTSCDKMNSLYIVCEQLSIHSDHRHLLLFQSMMYIHMCIIYVYSQ